MPLIVFHSRRVRDVLKYPETWGEIPLLLLITAVVGGLATPRDR